MSMVDFAASGVPLVVSNTVGEPDRATGNGKMCEENDVASLADVLRGFTNVDERRARGAAGRQKVYGGFNWTTIARTIENDFLESLGGNGQQS